MATATVTVPQQSEPAEETQDDGGGDDGGDGGGGDATSTLAFDRLDSPERR